MDDSALPADHEPDAIVMRLESVSMPAQAPFDASTPWPVQPQAPARAVPDQQTPLRARVARVRKVVVASDCIILAGFFSAGLVFNRPVLAAFALVLTVLLVIRASVLTRIPALTATTPVMKVWAAVFAPASAAVALSGSDQWGRSLVFGGVAVLGSLVLMRAVVRSDRVYSMLNLSRGRRCLLVGDEQTLAPMVAERNSWPGCEEVVGIMLQEPISPQAQAEGADMLIERVVAAAQEHRADQVTVVPGPNVGTTRLRELSWALEDTGIDLEVTTELQGVAPHRVSVDRVGDRLMMRIDSTTPKGSIAALKGTFDRVAAGVLLLLLSPLLIGLAVAIRVDSAGPALFRQTRVGKHGVEFKMYKFRTMVKNAEDVKQALLMLNDHGEAGVLFKMKEDPRVTRLGRILRRTSVDELPQLLNVVKGQMSLIGPRPALPSEVATYCREATRRLAVKPGMTGLWQVSGRSRLTWQESVKCDLDYVDNWSPGRETVIAMKTMKAVVNSDGAY